MLIIKMVNALKCEGLEAPMPLYQLGERVDGQTYGALAERPFSKSSDQGRVASIQAGKGINPISKKGMFGGYCLVGPDAASVKTASRPIAGGQTILLALLF